jgi:hypothetical protein
MPKIGRTAHGGADREIGQDRVGCRAVGWWQLIERLLWWRADEDAMGRGGNYGNRQFDVVWWGVLCTPNFVQRHNFQLPTHTILKVFANTQWIIVLPDIAKRPESGLTFTNTMLVNILRIYDPLILVTGNLRKTVLGICNISDGYIIRARH